MVEQMSSVAEESSNGWNNAGTGHAALMELNYTPQTANGINIDKAVDINEAFHISRQFLGASGDARRPEQTKIFH